MKKQILIGVILVSSVLSLKAQWVDNMNWIQNNNGRNLLMSNETMPIIRLSNSNYIYSPSVLTKRGYIQFENANSDKISYIFSAIPAGYHTHGIGISVKASYDAPDNDVLFVHPNGNMGIGTTNPMYAKLDIRDANTVFQVRSSLSAIVTGAEGGGAVYFGVDNANSATTPTAAIETSWGGYLTPQIGIGVIRDGLKANILMDYSNQTWFRNGTTTNMFIKGNGAIGIGTTMPAYKLDVNGTIHAREVKVDLNFVEPADYVFESNYNLMPLSELEKFVKTEKHLPEIPAGKTIKEDGLNMGEMQNKLLQKIEELTLYTIEQNKKIEQLQEQNKELQIMKEEIEKLKAVLK